MKIKFKDLSTPLKIAYILSWFTGSIYVLYFIVGMVEGALGI